MLQLYVSLYRNFDNKSDTLLLLIINVGLIINTVDDKLLMKMIELSIIDVYILLVPMTVTYYF